MLQACNTLMANHTLDKIALLLTSVGHPYLLVTLQVHADPSPSPQRDLEYAVAESKHSRPPQPLPSPQPVCKPALHLVRPSHVLRSHKLWSLALLDAELKL